MVKIDILIGHEEADKLHFILKIRFLCIFIEKPCILLKLSTVTYESIAYCLFC